MRKPDYPRLNSQTLKKRLEAGILVELLPNRQWVVWRFVLVNKRWKKQPFNPVTAGQQKPITEKPGAPFHKLSIVWKQENITASALSSQTKTRLPALIWTAQSTRTAPLRNDLARYCG